jgi:hypothetical protein
MNLTRLRIAHQLSLLISTAVVLAVVVVRGLNGWAIQPPEPK